ncbi:MAG: hypothetical protein QOJ02_36 [Acidobacteriota bacterium]|jgi:hypothetical protein|nr:hypothetical protein [Acidobacteriota bacterium]
MAEEGTLGQARASSERDDGDVEPSKEELQRRMEEARESITQTVTEIKETVTNQYYSVKETVSDALDWRHHFRQRPIAFSVGALSVGFLVGYGLAGAFKGDGSGSDYPSYEESDVYARTGATPSKYEEEYDEERPAALHEHYYAAQSVADNSSESSEDEGEQKPGLIERFRGTPVYDRLQTEVSSLGDRFIDELSSTAHKVVLPALFNKIKEMFGVDLSNKQGQPGGETAQAGGAQATNAQAAGASAASRGSSGSSYATSENQGYGSQSSTGGSGTAGGSDSVLDLDR